MLLLLGTPINIAETPNLLVRLGDLFEVYWGPADSPRSCYTGPHGQKVIMVRLSSMEASSRANVVDSGTLTLKSVDELQQREKILNRKRQAIGSKKTYLLERQLKDTTLFLRNNDLLVPIKGITRVIEVQDNMDASPVALVPCQHFLLLRKRLIHTQIFTPYLTMIAKLLLERIGKERYKIKADEVEGRYGLFNTFTKKDIVSISFHIHADYNTQKAVYESLTKLAKDIQPLYEVYESFRDELFHKSMMGINDFKI